MKLGLYKNIIANFLGVIFTTVLTFLVVPYYLEWLGPESYGLVGFATLLQNWLMIISAGFNPVAGRFAARAQSGHERWSDAYTLFRSIDGFIFAVGFCIVIFLLLLPVSSYDTWFNASNIDKTVLSRSAILLVIVSILRLASAVNRGIIANLEMQIWLNLHLSIFSFLRFAASLPIVYIYRDVISLFNWWAFVSILEYGTLQLKIKNIIPVSGKFFSFSLMLLKKHGKFALTLSFTSLVWVAITQLDKVIFTKLMTLESFGVFSTSVLLSSGVLLLSQPLTQALQPRLIKAYASGGIASLESELRSATKLIIITLLPVCAVLSLRSEDVMYLWTANSDIAHKAAVYLPGYVIGNYFAALLGLLYLLQVAVGDVKLHFKGNVFFSLLLIPIMVYLALNFEPVFVSYFWAIANFIMLVCWGGFVVRKFAHSLRFVWVLVDVVIPTLTLILISFFLLSLIDVSISECSRVNVFINLVCSYLLLLILTVLLIFKLKLKK